MHIRAAGAYGDVRTGPYTFWMINRVSGSRLFLPLNTQYMTNPTIVYPVKMEYGWNFSISGIKMMVKSGLEFFFEISLCTHHFIFITEFELLIKIPPFYEVNSFNRKWLAHGEISKIFFSRPLFTIIFRPEMLKFHPYSILTQ